MAQIKPERSHLFTWKLPPDEAVTLDDILVYLGEFGRYQRYLFVLLMLFCLFLTFVYFTQTFLTVVPTEHWCKLPKHGNVSSEQLRGYMVPGAHKVPYEGHRLPYSRCYVYDVPVETAVSDRQSSKNWPLKKCDDWEFKLHQSDVPYMSVAAEFGWVCDESYKVTLAQSIFFVGSIFGGLLFGWMADRYGRVPVLVISNLMGFIGGIGTIYVNQFWQFCACRFVVGLAYDNVFTFAYILVLEYVGSEWRTYAASMSYGLFYSLGAVCLPWLAYWLKDWRLFSLVTSVPLASAIVAPFVVPESVRWLIGKGRIEKAMKIIRSIERTNRIDIPQDVYEEFVKDCEKTADELSVESYSIADLFRTKRLRNTSLLLMISWGVIQMSYDGHVRCLDRLGLDVFTAFTIASATEFPAELLNLYTLDVLGRRLSLFTAVFLSGLFSLFAASVSIGVTFASFAICSRFFVNIASNVAMQYAAELLPTVIRGEGVALVHVFGYVTSIASPVIAFSSRSMHNLPMIVLGVCCASTSLLCLFLPETLMEQLPQSMMDGELFGIDQTFWETPFTRRRPLEPRVHHLHAKRAATRPDVLRSSMISGYKGVRTRHGQMKQRASQVAHR
ncbi:organic cation transporter protein [Xylocopa sonorina]|uniref:organic cation transporter protein n=1 Tax=Xylocopa sonorina TaxID=1818115 RepID=UPI00403ADA79